MPQSAPSPYTLLDESFRASPSLRHSKHLPHRSDDHRTYSRTAAPLQRDLSYTTTTTDNDCESVASRQPTPLETPGVLGRAESGLPPTPPTISHDGHAAQTLEPPPHADSVVNSLMSKNSSLSTPVNARSPPTPDPSPPRTNASSQPSQPSQPPQPSQPSQPVSERPPMFTYPSSRAESFRTAREDLSSNPDSGSETPVGDRLSTVQEDRGLGLAFEHEHEHAQDDVTPTNSKRPYFEPAPDADTTAGAEEDKESPVEEKIPDREWNTDLMRNVTVRRKRNSKSSPLKDSKSSPLKDSNPPAPKEPALNPPLQDPISSPVRAPRSSRRRGDSTSSRQENATSSPRKRTHPAVVIVESASPTPSTRTRRTSALRERVEASNNSPVTPSIENFAQSIGWPTESRDMAQQTPRDANSKRMSTSSTTSTMVEAMVIVTPPRRHQTLRHSGKNMAYRRDLSSPAEFGSESHSNRNSLHLDDVPLHRLVHKRLSVADRQKRISTDSGPLAYERPLGYERNMSPALSMRSTRTIDSSRHTLAHQESVRRVLQPAADILSRSSTVGRPQPSGTSYHRRNTSAPESARRMLVTPGPRNFSQLSPPPQTPPIIEESSLIGPSQLKRPVTPTLSPKPHLTTPASRKQDRSRRPTSEAISLADTNKTLPELPVREKTKSVAPGLVADDNALLEEKRVPSGLMERVRRLVADHEGTEESTLIPSPSHFPASPENLNNFSPLEDLSPPMRRGSRSRRGRSGERRWSLHSQDRSSASPDFPIRPSLDRISTEEMSRRSHEWRRRSVENGRVSFDLSTVHSEEHADARHLYAQGTPFSQMSDTLEVSEATAVSIYPHNNHSLLVVQQVPRSNSFLPGQPLLTSEAHLSTEDPRDMQSTPTPPFVDAIEGHEEKNHPPPQPTLHFEPSTPPMNLDLPQPDAVDTPLQNPRPPPEPPVIMFIPPTPAEELERELVPGPPKRSESHPQRQPQRRSTLVQRARRYSDNLITPLLARASINRRRHASDPNTDPRRNPRVPSVNDEDGTLHPFWRPRGFWDGFEDSDDESDGDDALPSGGDTSDIEDDEPSAPPRRTSTLGRKLTSGLRGSGGFLIGNSLGVERHGTNKRRHHITLPSHFPKSSRTSNDPSSPRVLVKSPPEPLRARGGGGISKRRSNNSLRSNMSYEAPGRRASWRQGRSLPGIKKYQVQYIGLTGVKENFKERRAEKRRNKLRKSIGSRYYVEPVGSMST
ncbi:hypothetical protein T440DRAFT_168732 [Plenodomus tracheiphilus IPT5]|uniref:Uncharacterized protein n=1 Tax=Plenodomus tracheiphilus IPT5 TaxID=1408161 RepID=A0A6A7AZ55_9PLEO|nr:hypothetical protein T440DRAFT_168732 [Plenodomus tracheiphilus IPT5]